MSWTTYTDIAKFLNQYEPFLFEEEAKNNMLLQVISRAIQNPSSKNSAFANGDGSVAIFFEGSLVFNSTQTISSAELAAPLLDFIRAQNIPLKRAMGTELTSRSFVREWLKLNYGLKIQKEFSMVLQKLEIVTPFERAPGIFRRAWIEELDQLSIWMKGFFTDTGVGNETSLTEREITLQMINNKQLFTWNSPKLVSMVGMGGSTTKGIRVHSVYTPPEKRGNGFAKAAVAALSELQLSQGKEFLVLYSDVLQPENTAMYQKIGYQPIDNHFTYFFSDT